METKEEREARERALEVKTLLEEQSELGWSIDPKLSKQLAEMGTWTSAVDDLLDSIKVNCKPKDMNNRKQNGDEYTVPEHKHLKKLIALEDRIARWKQVGPAVTEQEWDVATNDLEWVTEWRRNCSKDANLRIPKAFQVRMNRFWKKYATKADKLITKNEK